MKRLIKSGDEDDEEGAYKDEETHARIFAATPIRCDSDEEAEDLRRALEFVKKQMEAEAKTRRS